MMTHVSTSQRSDLSSSPLFSVHFAWPNTFYGPAPAVSCKGLINLNTVYQLIYIKPNAACLPSHQSPLRHLTIYLAAFHQNVIGFLDFLTRRQVDASNHLIKIAPQQRIEYPKRIQWPKQY